MVSAMTSDASDESPSLVVDRIRDCQENSDWEAAANLLADHVIDLLDHLNASQLTTLIAPFPQRWIEQSPGLWYAVGLVNARLQNIQNAINWLDKAVDYLQGETIHLDRLIWCFLELARLHYALDDFRLVKTYIDRAEALMQQSRPLKPLYEAFFHYMVGCLCADTGRTAEGWSYAQRSAHQYRALRKHASEFRAWLAVCSFSRQVGDYQVALNAVEQARACYEEGQLESAAYEALLNAETHLAWYRGHLMEALAIAQMWVRFSRGGGFHRRRLYAHWMMGNVLRALERYEQALHYYEQARRIAAEHTPNFIRWIDAQESWLALLQGDYATAEALIQRALAAADHGLTMSFQVNLAVVELFTGRWRQAEEHLRESLAFYQQSQDRQATCAISFYLAYLHIERRARPGVALKILRPELRWLERCDNAYFPLWWHPEIVSRVAVFLLDAPEFHALARRFFRQPYLGDPGTRALRAMYPHARKAQHAEIAELLAARGELAPIDISTCDQIETNHVIAAAIERGLIAPAMLPLLFQRLRGVRQRDHENPTLVAIFLLHIQGVSSGDIAQRLHRSRSLISHSLQAIYETLGVSRAQGTRIDQRTALMQAARAEGLLL
jgi:tetratricopeptide (TPR) repeat protein